MPYTYSKDRTVYLATRCLASDTSTGYGPYRSGTTRTLTRTLQGNVNPFWQYETRNGLNATTQLNAEFQSCDSTVGVIRNWFLWDPVNAYDSTTLQKCEVVGRFAEVHFSAEVPSAFGWIDSVDDLALARAWQAIRRQQVAFSAPTFLGELRETLRMIKRPAAALQERAKRYAKKLNDRMRRKPRGLDYNESLLDTAGQLWLEESFGWTPLMMDIDEGWEAFDKVLETRMIPFSAGAVKKKRVSDVSSLANFVPGSNKSWCTTRKTTDQILQIRYKGALRPEFELSKTDKLARFGFTPSEFVPTVWELLPWSFLVDYFTNVGDVLSSTVTSDRNLAWVNLTTRRVALFRGVMVPWQSQSQSPIPHKSRVYWEGHASTTTVARSWVTRDVGVRLSIPQMRLKFPAFDTAPTKWLNIAALMATCSTLHPQRVGSRNYRL